MGWNPLALIGLADKTADIIKEAVTDKDKQNELLANIAIMKEQTYQAELAVQTIPWVDALHKMGRQILSLLSLVIPALLLYYKPEIDPLSLAAMTAPGGVYNYIKGKGR